MTLGADEVTWQDVAWRGAAGYGKARRDLARLGGASPGMSRQDKALHQTQSPRRANAEGPKGEIASLLERSIPNP